MPTETGPYLVGVKEDGSFYRIGYFPYADQTSISPDYFIRNQYLSRICKVGDSLIAIYPDGENLGLIGYRPDIGLKKTVVSKRKININSDGLSDGAIKEIIEMLKP